MTGSKYKSKCGKIHSDFSLSSEVVAQSEKVWDSVVRKHPELRPAFIRFDDLKLSKGYVKVFFAAIEYENGQRYHEVMVRSDLAFGHQADLVQAILHAAVHCLNYDRGFYDTRRGLIHNEQFRATAEELGLQTFWVDGYGYMSKIGKMARATSIYKNSVSSFRRLLPAKRVDYGGVTI